MKQCHEFLKVRILHAGAGIIAIVSTFLIISCSKTEVKTKSEQVEGATKPSHSEMKSKLSQIYSSNFIKNLDSCDSDQRALRLEIIEVLESNTTLMSALNQIQNLTDDPTVEVGNTFFRNGKAKNRQSEDSFDIELFLSWSNAIQFYSEIKDSSNIDDWVQLFRDVQELVILDHRRVVGGNKYKESFSLNDMLKKFSPDKTVFRDPSGKLWIKLDAGDFEDSKLQLQDLIEKEFAKKGLDFGIQLVKNSNSSPQEFFKLILDPTQPFHSAHMSWKEATIYLYPGNQISAIVHELGHALGFEDHYSTLWNPTRCEYIFVFDPNDIMADSDYGRFTPEEIKILEENYPKIAVPAVKEN